MTTTDQQRQNWQLHQQAPEPQIISECCGYPAGDYFDIGICPKCKEHCEFFDEGEELE